MTVMDVEPLDNPKLYAQLDVAPPPETWHPAGTTQVPLPPETEAMA